MKNLKILFMGTPYFAAQALKSLINADFNIIGVISQPDKEVGRGKKMEEPETKKVAKNYDIPVFQPESKEALNNIVNELNPDLIIVAAYGKIISKNALEVPKFGTLNIHGSILPKFRGSSCIAQSILEGDDKTGITIMEVTEEMDAGDIISSVEVDITPEDTTASLTEKLAKTGADEIVRIVPLWVEGEIKSCEQCHAEATFCKLIRKEDGKIDWDKDAFEIERMTRAFYPWPTAFSNLEGKLIKIIKAKVVTEKLNPGKIKVENKNIYVGCGKDSLEILVLQPEGKKEMPAKDYLNGNPDINGKTFS
jgi:methionyl-tRNA formyltransferase